MVEEAEKIEEREEVVEQEQEQEIPEGMQKALDDGWRPEEEWTGDPDRWVDWKTFNRNGEFMGRIQEQSSIIAHLKEKAEAQDKALKDTRDLYDKIAEREYKKAYNALRKEKAEALEAGETARVLEIDDEIQDLRDNKPEPSPTVEIGQETKDALPPEVIAWVERPENSWYTNDRTLHNYANATMGELKELNPMLSPGELLRRMENKIKQELPHKFKRQPTRQPVDDGTGNVQQRSKASKKPTFNDLG